VGKNKLILEGEGFTGGPIPELLTQERRIMKKQYSIPDMQIPNWRPIKFAAVDPKDYMFMGVVEQHDLTIHMYKHRDTRAYINLDKAGNFYVLGEGYVPIPRPDLKVKMTHWECSKCGDDILGCQCI